MFALFECAINNPLKSQPIVPMLYWAQARPKFKNIEQGMRKQIGGRAHEFGAKLDSYMRGMVGGSLKSFGLFYAGPVDGPKEKASPL